MLYANNPGYTAAVAAGGVPRDPGVAFAAAQIISYLDEDIDPNPLVFLEPNIGARVPLWRDPNARSVLLAKP